MSFSKLRLFRKGCNLTLKDVAARTGLSISFLSDIERGRSSPSLSTIKRLAEVYQAHVEDLIEYQGREFSDGAWVHIANDASPETLQALSEMLRCLAGQFDEIAKSREVRRK